MEPSSTVYHSASAAETEAFGRRLAADLQPGDVVALHGDLGAGKTHLVRGVAAGLGVPPAEVSSPTFTLVHEYMGAVPVVHIDAYRIEHPEEMRRLGFDEYLDGEAVVLVEWPERIAPVLPAYTRHLYLEHAGGDTRVLRWEAP